MELIRNLGTRLGCTGKLESWGVFLCPAITCGREIEMRLSNGKKAKSCGCILKYYKHGESKTRLYNIWRLIIQRILNSKNKSYKNYGGRDITICNEWLEFIPFRDWSLNNGYSDILEINRINNDGNYEPNNCEWVIRTENARNKTNTITIKIANEIRGLHKIGNYTQKQLADKFNVNYVTISNIINNKSWRNK